MDDKLSEQFIELRDGRKLGYQTLGAADGYPLMFFHGTPGSRLVLAATDAIAMIPGLRLILPERPGYGISDPKPERTICDWAGDVNALADELGLDRFAVAGGSGGGPYALACGARLQNRVDRVVLLNTAAPVHFKGATKGMAIGNRIGVWLARFSPWTLRKFVISGIKAFQKAPEEFVASLSKQLPAADQKLLAREDYAQAIIRDMKEAFRGGSEGQFRDAVLGYSKSGWGFEMGDVLAPVHIWHGEADSLSPIQTVQRMAEKIPNCHAHYLPGAGHLLVDYPDVVKGVAELFNGEA